MSLLLDSYDLRTHPPSEQLSRAAAERYRHLAAAAEARTTRSRKPFSHRLRRALAHSLVTTARLVAPS